MMESFGLTKKRRIIAHDYVPVMSTNNAKSHNISHAGPLAADVQNMKSQQSDGESAQSDGWVMDQNSFSSEQSSDSSVASVDEINDDIDRTMRGHKPTKKAAMLTQRNEENAQRQRGRKFVQILLGQHPSKSGGCQVV